MLETNSLWFEIAIVSITFTLGHILLGHFEERSPRTRKLIKYLVTLMVVVGLPCALEEQSHFQFTLFSLFQFYTYTVFCFPKKV